MTTRVKFTHDKIEAREQILKDLENFVVGPNWEDSEEVSIEFDPLNQYSSGILFPIIIDSKDKNTDLNVDDDIEETIYNNDDPDHELGQVNQTSKKKKNSKEKEDEGRNDTFSQNIIDQSTQSKQSSFGITFITKESAKIKIKYGFSKYHKPEHSEQIFCQRKFTNEVEIEIDSSNSLRQINQDLLDANNLKLSIRSRKYDESKIISTVSLSRTDKYIYNSDEVSGVRFNECLFHVGIKIKTDSEFLPIFSPAKLGGSNSKRLDLLFRNKKSFSTGTGCASSWEASEGKVKVIHTDFLPSYKIPEIKALDSQDLSYSKLANIDESIGDDNYLESAIDLKIKYSNWIKKQIEKSKDIDEDFQEAAKININEASEWHKRISNGIDCIIGNKSVMTAFRLTNHAMAIQFNRYRGLKSKKGYESIIGDENFIKRIGGESLVSDLSSNNHLNLNGGWRPFQLAFLLGVIPDILNQDNEFRDIVDLIWFPTGGGKTEAYLGVLAFTILFRRIEYDGDAGVTAIMRYTLRLLTSDQFRRCSALITTLEYLRHTRVLRADLGEDPISIGLWIGKSDSAPGTHREAARFLSDTKTKTLPFILNECPWCKTDLVDCKQKKVGYVENNNKVIIKCPDDECSFSEDINIPIFLWQEAIFEQKPTLLIGTVDNFTKLAWNEIKDHKAQEMLKNKTHHPPELIIQDELHLISGPLGSMVGMYENILLGILEENGNKPKIIGATATLSLDGNQSENLYRGRSSKIFPPQVINWGDSYFAEEKEISNDFPGRLYVGYLGGAKSSPIEASFNIAIPLLQAPQVMLPITAEGAIKGNTSLKAIWPDEINKTSKISIFHSKKESEGLGNMETYEVKKIEAVTNTDEQDIYIDGFSLKNIFLDKPLKADIPKNKVLYFIELDSYDKHRSTWDPYGTIVWYFNSKKELSSVSNQQVRLEDVLRTNARYLNKGKLGPKDYPIKFSRKIYNCEELTGRLPQKDIEEIKGNLDLKWTQSLYGDQRRGIDILFATNMISVGVDIPRLGTMIVNGQPRTTSEYIQASSRVGREHPGIVVTTYNHTKSKDRSIYETFVNYHQSIYKYVESSSITPYSKGSRDRCLESVFIGVATLFGVKGPELSRNDDEKLKQAKDWILSAVKKVDPSEYDDTKEDLNKIINIWKNRTPVTRGNMSGNNQGVALMGPPSSNDDEVIFKAPLTMRGSEDDTELVLWKP